MIVDARGLKCPWPALRLARAMRSADKVRISADDPRAADEFAVLARENDWIILADGPEFLVAHRR